MLMKASSQSLTEQLAGRFSERIRNRLLAPGARLPSVRQCAEQHGVSPSTVVAAYDQLLALGFRTVPVTVIGSTAVRGFDPDALLRALEDAR